MHCIRDLQAYADVMCRFMWQVLQLPARELRQQQKPAKKLPLQETQSLAHLSPVLSSRLSSPWRATWVEMTLTWAKQVPTLRPCVPQSMHCLGAYTGDTHIACTVMPRYTCCVHVCDIIAMLWFCGLVRCQLLSSALRALGDVGN